MKRLFIALAVLATACAPAAQQSLEPLALEGSDATLIEAYDLAIRTVRQNIKKNGTITAGKEYGGEWTRDISINTRNACNIVCPEQAVYSLWKVTRDGGSRVGHQYWDKIIWVPAAYEQYLTLGADSLLTKSYICSANTMTELEASVYDESMQLFCGPSVFNDGISGYEVPVFDPLIESGNVLDHPATYKIKCLSTNCIYHEAYRTLATMALACADSSAAAQYSAKAECLRSVIRERFYDAEKHELAYLIDQNGDLHHFQEGLGYAFAVLCGIVDEAEAHEIFANAHVAAHGVPSIWPDFKRFSADMPGRHNNLVWPHVNTFFAEAALKAGHPDMFVFELRNLADLAVNVSGGHFYEIYNPQTGEPDGGWQMGGNLNSSVDQTWCATGYLSLIYRGVMGMEYSAEGLRMAPDKALMDELGITALHALPYRAATVNVSRGHSPLRRGVYVNGHKATKGALIAPDAEGVVEVVVY